MNSPRCYVAFIQRKPSPSNSVLEETSCEQEMELKPADRLHFDRDHICGHGHNGADLDT